jgi:hypothetical protein
VADTVVDPDLSLYDLVAFAVIRRHHLAFRMDDQAPLRMPVAELAA